LELVLPLRRRRGAQESMEGIEFWSNNELQGLQMLAYVMFKLKRLCTRIPLWLVVPYHHVLARRSRNAQGRTSMVLNARALASTVTNLRRVTIMHHVMVGNLYKESDAGKTLYWMTVEWKVTRWRAGSCHNIHNSCNKLKWALVTIECLNGSTCRSFIRTRICGPLMNKISKIRDHVINRTSILCNTHRQQNRG